MRFLWYRNQIATDSNLSTGMTPEQLLARDVQRRLLPRRLPVVPGLEYDARFEPASEVGGDYYDVFRLPGGKFAFVIADVAGKIGRAHV